MDTRQEQLLKLVIENHIATAEPVGSKFLVSESGLDWSEATVRNELRVLEEEGFLTHPHTSAGRLPTEKGYRYFVDHLDLTKAKLGKKDLVALETVSRQKGDRESVLKTVAKTLAEVSGETVLIAFTPDKIFYTGLSNLFNKPDFNQLQLVADISAMFDHCEECLEGFLGQVNTATKFFIGREHTFGQMLSIGSFRFGEDSLLALLGLQRMDYKRNWALLNKIKEII
jgi:transcriptional regulator of heat shock response